MSSKRLVRSSWIAIVVIGLVGLVLLRAKLLFPAAGARLLPTATPAAVSAAGGSQQGAATSTPAFRITILPSDTTGPVTGIGPGQVSLKDGMQLVSVPAGDFLMGSDQAHDTGANADEFPQHDVRLDAFWIDQTDVTNAMYAKCVAGGSCAAPQAAGSSTHPDYYADAAYADYPVINVDWNQAQAYCQWAGRQLPTEAQWEKAARGTDGRIFPWGNQSPDTSLANFNSVAGDTTRAGSYPAGASPYGALDMAGNVWDWAADWYGVNDYTSAAASNPAGPSVGTARVLRGGSWHNGAVLLRSAGRGKSAPGYWSNNAGIRCALTP